jgi:colanic acid biosynthesis glycosyl transferase WcaI
MHILLFVPTFPPEISAPATRLSAHAKHWIEMGHDVTVVTSAPNAPSGKLFKGYTNNWYQEETINGLHIIRPWTYLAANEGVFRRTIDYASYPLSCWLQAGRFPRADVILASSPNIFVPVAGSLVSRRMHIPWVFEVRDLWPAAIGGVDLGKRPVLKTVEALELGLYRSARRIIVLTKPFKENICGRGVDPAKVDIITNGIDEGFLSKRGRDETRKALGVADGTFLVGFVGTLGLCQEPSVLVRTAARLRDRTDIRFLIVGEGAARASTEALAKANGLANIEFRDVVPHDEVPGILSALDLGTVVLRDHPAFHTVIPSKIFELAALKCPIAAAVTGEAKRIIEEIGGGMCVPPGNDEAFADLIRRMAASPQMRADFGDRAAQAVHARYARRSLAAKALDSLMLAAGMKAEVHALSP